STARSPGSAARSPVRRMGRCFARDDPAALMAGVIYKGAGGTVVLPKMVFLDRLDGGHLIINPPHEVWEQSELSAIDLAHWCFLVGAIGRAMIDVLPQLEAGCVNYFEAGNWALNDAAPPKGRKKRAPDYR